MAVVDTVYISVEKMTCHTILKTRLHPRAFFKMVWDLPDEDYRRIFGFVPLQKCMCGNEITLQVPFASRGGL